MMKSSLNVAIIGGTSGIGLATAKLMDARGATVTIVGRNRTKLEEALRTLGPRAGGETADAGDRRALDALFAKVGMIDHLVLAASGGAGAGTFGEIDEAGLRRGFEAKFWVQWNAAQSARSSLSANGTITFITAASSRFANPGTAGLAAINGALDRMVPTLARELAPLRVNAVSPGVVDTAWWADKPAGMFEAAANMAPLARAGGAEEIADAVAFLIGNEFVTGIVLDVDGGLHLT